MRQRPFSSEEINVIYILLVCAGVAVLAQLGRSLSNMKRGEPFMLAQTIGGLIGAGVASFCFGAMAIEWWNFSPLLAIAMSGPVGWGGGDLMAGVAKQLADRISNALGGDNGKGS